MRSIFRASLAALVVLTFPIAAVAADLKVKAKPTPPPPFSWTGFYIGGNLGGAWAQGNIDDNILGLDFGSGSNTGVFIGGGQIGGNYQINNYVIGVEGDFDWAANTGNTSNIVFVPAIGNIQVTSNNRWVSTLAARFGVAYDQSLFYGKAGAGWVGNGNFTVTNTNTGTSISGPNSNTNTGWLLGAGWEWAFASNWSAKIEYNYLGLSGRTFTVPVGSPLLAGDTFSTSSRSVQMLKVGVNFRFGDMYR